jgi:Putative DNA-binding domain
MNSLQISPLQMGGRIPFSNERDPQRLSEQDATIQGISKSEIKPIMTNVQVVSSEKYPMYIRDANITVEESRLAEFKAVTKSKYPILDIIGVHLTKNFVAFLNSVGKGEIGKIYFGIDDAGKIIGTILNEEERDLLPSTIRRNLKNIQPPLTDEEYEIHMVPVCADNTKCPLENLFVVEIHIKSAPHPIYFNNDGRQALCWIRRPAGVVKLSGVGTTDLFISRLNTQAIYTPDNLVIQELDGKRLKDMPVEELKQLGSDYQKKLEATQKRLKFIKNTLREKREVALRVKEKEIADLKKQLESLKNQ